MALLTKREFRCPDCGEDHGEWISVVERQSRRRCEACSRAAISTDHRLVE